MQCVVVEADHPRTFIALTAPRRPRRTAASERGQLEEAIPLLELTLADRERVLGQTHPATLTSRINLAAAYQDGRRLGNAEGLRNRTEPGSRISRVRAHRGIARDGQDVCR